MGRDPLQVLRRLRGITLDAARRALADRLGEETAAASRAADVAGTIARETAAQGGQPDFGATSDNYAAWLARMQDERRAARQTERAATEAVGRARTAVTEERAAARALEAALAHALESRRTAEARQEQRALDEAAALSGARSGHRCGRPRGRPWGRWSG